MSTHIVSANAAVQSRATIGRRYFTSEREYYFEMIHLPSIPFLYILNILLAPSLRADVIYSNTYTTPVKKKKNVHDVNTRLISLYSVLCTYSILWPLAYHKSLK